MLLALVARHYSVTCDNNTGELCAAKPGHATPSPGSHMAGLFGKRLFANAVSSSSKGCQCSAPVSSLEACQLR